MIDFTGQGDLVDAIKGMGDPDASWNWGAWDKGGSSGASGQPQPTMPTMNSSMLQQILSGAGGYQTIMGAGSGLQPNGFNTTGPSGGMQTGGPGGAQFQFPGWSADPRENSLYSALASRASQSLTPSASDPVIANQVNAYRAEQTRGSRDYLNQLAESKGPQANTSMEARMANEQASQSTGQMQAQLMQNEVNARRQEIQNALSQMGGTLSDDQRLSLQKELAYLSNDQFLRQLGLSADNQANYWDSVRSGLIGG
jgi:hypothetical protein